MAVPIPPDTDTDLGAILLAAGGSRRLGQPKQLIRSRGETLVHRAARIVLEQNPAALIVVTGCESNAVERELEGLPVEMVRNSKWADGMGVSLACGMARVPDRIGGVLILLCDQWRIASSDLASLVTAWTSDISQIAVAQWAQSHGPPVIMPKALFPELAALKGDRGAKAVLAKHRDMVNYVPMDSARFDLDDEADLETLLQA